MAGTLVGGCRCTAFCCDLDLTFDLALATLKLNPLLAISQMPQGVGS